MYELQCLCMYNSAQATNLYADKKTYGGSVFYSLVRKICSVRFRKSMMPGSEKCCLSEIQSKPNVACFIHGCSSEGSDLQTPSCVHHLPILPFFRLPRPSCFEHIWEVGITHLFRKDVNMSCVYLFVYFFQHLYNIIHVSKKKYLKILQLI